MKMELIEGSETSANHNRTPGKYPKEYMQVLYLLVIHLELNVDRYNDIISITAVWCPLTHTFKLFKHIR